MTQNPGELPGMPPEYAQHFGPGQGGVRSRNAVQADPRCAERGQREREAVYGAGLRRAASAPAAAFRAGGSGGCGSALPRPTYGERSARPRA